MDFIIRLTSKVLKRKEFTLIEKLILAVIDSSTDLGEGAYESNEEIANMLYVDISTVSMVMDKLLTKKVISNIGKVERELILSDSYFFGAIK